MTIQTIEQVLGWESFDPEYFPGPADVVAAPGLRPAPLSLVTACQVYDVGPKANNMPADGYAWCSDVPMPNDPNCPGKAIVNVFLAVELDDRSTAGWAASDAMSRVIRGLQAHEAWVVENQWWTGSYNEANAHLNAADPIYPFAFQSGGSPYTATGLENALSLLEQAIAYRDAGVGVIHCTPFVFNAWAMRGGIPFRYDGGNPGSATKIYTPNGNLVVPGYGYDGSGPADAPSIDNPQWQKQQWAYVTDMPYLLRGPLQREPDSLSEMSPALPIYNDVPWRAMRPWAIYSNGALRAAVLVDTTTQ